MFYEKFQPAALLLAAIFLLKPNIAPAQKAQLSIDNSPFKSVNPFIGTGGHGHTFPGATAPWGMVQLSPDTRPDPGDWDGCGGYHFSDSLIYGFSHTHLSGTGISDYCDLLMQPVAAGAGFEQRDFASPFSKKTERAEPGFYEVFLDKPATKVELTASERTGWHRYTFPKAAKTGSVLIDLRWRDIVLESELDFTRIKEGIISGHRHSRSWASDQRFFFEIRFSRPIKSSRLADVAGRDIVEREVNNDLGHLDQSIGRLVARSGLAVILEFDLSAGGPLVAEVGISGVDVDGAKGNREAESTNNDFDKARQRTRDVWEKQLSKIEIEGGSPRDRTVFYTALYHTMLAPNIWSDTDGRYRGRDNRTHQVQKGATVYTVFSLWDTYRALHPLMTILEPARVRDWMYTFWRQSVEGGRLPVWELAANETNCMIGNHSIPVIADAYLKGLVPDSLVEPLYQAMKKAATDGSRGLDLYEKYGYIPSDMEPESVSKTIEYSFDDYCVGLVAGNLKKHEDFAFFSKRAENLENLEDPETGFFRPKSNGAFIEPFDPTEVNFNYTEGNAWQYIFPHMPIFSNPFQPWKKELLGEFFTTTKPLTGRVQADLTGLTGQFVIGNEPDMHTPFLFNRIGRPGRTDSLVNEILSKNFSTQPDGLPGNDDCGQMSAWVVWAMMGLYPVDPVGAVEACETTFSKLTIHLPNGKSSVLLKGKQPNNISSGESLGYCSDLMKGGTFYSDDRFGSIIHIRPVETGTRLSWTEESETQFWMRTRNGNQLPVPYWTGGQMVFHDPQEIVLRQPTQWASIRYTIDGTEPTEESLLYRSSILIQKTCTLKAFAQYKGIRSKVMEAHFIRQPDRKNWSVIYAAPPNTQYPGRGERGLIDGLRGGADFRSGGWQGFDGKELEATIDMGELREVSKITAGFLQDDNSWIFLPQAVSFETSADGKDWQAATTALARAKPKEEPGDSFLEDFSTTLPSKRKVRYLRVKTTSHLQCPAWHKGAGNAAWLFADEILVE